MKEKEYIVEKWFKISEIFDSKNKAIEEKKQCEENDRYKDIKIFEIEKTIKLIK